jgi:hypothetical protein
MTQEQEDHLSHIKGRFITLVDTKYRKGAEEHKSTLSRSLPRDLARMALDEAIDSFTYTLTLLDNLSAMAERLHRAEEALRWVDRDATSGSADPCAALGIISDITQEYFSLYPRP